MKYVLLFEFVIFFKFFKQISKKYLTKNFYCAKNDYQKPKNKIKSKKNKQISISKITTKLQKNDNKIEAIRLYIIK